MLYVRRCKKNRGILKILKILKIKKSLILKGSLPLILSMPVYSKYSKSLVSRKRDIPHPGKWTPVFKERPYSVGSILVVKPQLLNTFKNPEPGL